jgi:hypothetical protein
VSALKNRRRGLVLLAAVATAVLGGAVAAWLSTRPGPSAPARAPSPAALAQRACTLMTRMKHDVGDNAAASKVLAEVREADGLATQAAGLDQRYLTLSSGVQAVRAALDTNSATAATVGMAVVQSACEGIRASTRR